MNNLNEKGFGIVEVILVSSILSIVFLAIVGYLVSFSRLTSINRMELEALYHARSSLEQARAVRDGSNGWDILSNLDFSPTSHYNFQISGSSWVPVTGDKIIEKYTIWVVLDPVFRDINDDINLVGGTQDSNSMKVTTHVSFYAGGEAKEIELFEYLTNFR